MDSLVFPHAIIQIARAENNDGRFRRQSELLAKRGGKREEIWRSPNDLLNRCHRCKRRRMHYFKWAGRWRGRALSDPGHRSVIAARLAGARRFAQMRCWRALAGSDGRCRVGGLAARNSASDRETERRTGETHRRANRGEAAPASDSRGGQCSSDSRFKHVQQ